MKIKGNIAVLRFLLRHVEGLCNGSTIKGYDSIFWLNRNNRTVYYMSYGSYISGNIQGYPVAQYNDDYSYIMEVK